MAATAMNESWKLMSPSQLGFQTSIPNGYQQFLNPRDEKSIRAILWDGVSDCASLVTYTPTCGAR